MINTNLLDELNRLGFGADIDALESYVASLQDAAGMGTPIVTNTVYDQHYRLLKELRPDSYIFTRNWEAEDFDLDEYDIILSRYSMRSIATIQNMNDLVRFKGALGDKTVAMCASSKLNGIAVRAVYLNGILKTGSTRGQYKKGRDITRHLRAVLPNEVEAWKNIRIIEVRGEMLVSLKKFESLKHVLKTPLSAVTSLIKESVTDEELEYLNCVCYKVIPDNPELLKFETLWDEMSHLEENGFEIPPRMLIEDVNYYSLNDAVDQALEYFGNKYDNGELTYDTDGVVVAINDLDTFHSLGTDGNVFLGNFALKMGPHWESNIYSSTILEVIWEPGKKYLIPKAIIEPVITVTGAEVTNVPLYNVGIMEKFGYTPGKEIYFKFDRETGVATVQPDGTPVSAIE